MTSLPHQQRCYPNATAPTTMLSQRRRCYLTSPPTKTPPHLQQQHYPNDYNVTSPTLPHQRWCYPNNEYATLPTTRLPHLKLQQCYRTNDSTIPMTPTLPHQRCPTNDVAIPTTKMPTHLRQCYPTYANTTPPMTMLPHRQQQYPTDNNAVSGALPCLGSNTPVPLSLLHTENGLRC